MYSFWASLYGRIQRIAGRRFALLVVVFLAMTLLASYPAWASDLPQDINQTVPPPTAMPQVPAAAEPTPKPDDNQDEEQNPPAAAGAQAEPGPRQLLRRLLPAAPARHSRSRPDPLAINSPPW